MINPNDDVREDDNDDPSEMDGATVNLDPNVDDDAEQNEDGSATIMLDDEAPALISEFYENLAETLPESELNHIASNLMDLIERDREARKTRDKQYEEGIKRTGLGDDAPGGASFEGASRVVHPMLTEVCIDFSSRAMKEMFPPEGPARDFIPGQPTAVKMARAKRKTKYMNYQLTKQMPEFRSELEQTLTQVPLGGAQFIKMYYNGRLKRPMSEFVPIDDILIPYAASSFRSADRKTHVQYLTELEFKRRVRSGHYRDLNVLSPNDPELTGSSKALWPFAPFTKRAIARR